MIEFDDPRFIGQRMARVNGIGVKRRGLMRMRLGVVLVLFATVLVMGSQVGMRRRPLHRQKGGQQEKQESGVNALFDHDELP